MSKVLCIDPGTIKTGWAIFEKNGRKATLCQSGVIKSKKGDWTQHITQIIDQFDGLNMGLGIDLVLIEQPQIFMSGKGQAANNSGSVMKLTALAFALRQYFLDVYKYHFALKAAFQEIEVIMVPVKKWKGDQKKHITAQRMKKYWKHAGADDNETDAIGIGDWHLRKQLKCKPDSEW